jgi:hypothetical protein
MCLTASVLVVFSTFPRAAAAFTLAFLRTRPVEVGASAGVAADPS